MGGKSKKTKGGAVKEKAGDGASAAIEEPGKITSPRQPLPSPLDEKKPVLPDDGAESAESGAGLDANPRVEPEADSDDETATHDDVAVTGSSEKVGLMKDAKTSSDHGPPPDSGSQGVIFPHTSMAAVYGVAASHSLDETQASFFRHLSPSRLSLKIILFMSLIFVVTGLAAFFFSGFVSSSNNDFVTESHDRFESVCGQLASEETRVECTGQFSAIRDDVESELSMVRERTQSLVTVFASVVSLLLILSILFMYDRMILTPLNLIRKSFIKAERGDLDVRITLRSGDEFEDLASSFNHVLLHLKQSRSIMEYTETELRKDLLVRSRELNLKVKELEETRTAILNILEDVNQSKDDLEASQRQLLRLNEELKIANEELMKVDSYKNQFISVTAHELKTPLASIHGFASLLQNKTVAESTDQRNSYLRIIVEEADRLKRLIDDILDLSRLDLGTMKFFFEDVDPNEVMRNVYSELNVLAKKRDQVLELDIKSKLPRLVTDKTRLAQVLVNLVNNSIKYSTKKDGRIIISATSGKGVMTFSVKDQGVGIPRKSFSHIFQRFYQVDASFTRKVGGTGLGLSICKGLVEALGGKITFTSILGRGSTFSFTLPLVSSEKSSSERNLSVISTDKPKKKSAAPAGKGKKSVETRAAPKTANSKGDKSTARKSGK